MTATMGERWSRQGALLARLWGRIRERVEAMVDGIDAFQQRHWAGAVPSAVVRKYSDDQAGHLAGQISHSAFLAVFPMLLVLLTLVGIFLHGHPSVQNEIIDSALRQFPVLGPDLRQNVHQLSTENVVALVVGLVWLLYGSMRLSRSSQVMMAVVWGVDRDELPDFWHWIPRAAGFLVILGVGFLGGGALAGLGAFGQLGSFSAWIGLALSLVVNIAMYWCAFAILVRLPEDAGRLWPGAVFGGVGWTLLQFAGAQLVSHQLRHLSNLYGTFATVLGLIWWIALGAMVTVYAAEFDVVLARHQWPRSFRRARNRPGRVDGLLDGAGGSGGRGDRTAGDGDRDGGTGEVATPAPATTTATRGGKS